MLHDDDSKLEEHWWRVIEFLEFTGNSVIILNTEKFQFLQKIVDYAECRVPEDSAKPLPKYLDVIRENLTPRDITDMQSCFGFLYQVSFYAQL